MKREFQLHYSMSRTTQNAIFCRDATLVSLSLNDFLKICNFFSILCTGMVVSAVLLVKH